MKKEKIIIALILVLVVITGVFTACNGKGDTENTSTTVAEGQEQKGYSIEIDQKDAVISKDGKKIQKIKFPKDVDYIVNIGYARSHYEFIDMNFDGKEDLYIAVSKIDNIINYFCWIYDAEKDEFVYSEALSALKNISVDSKNKKILSDVSTDDATKILSYVWKDGVLELEKEYDSSTEDIPEDVTNALKDNTIGVNNNTVKPNTTQSSKPETTTKKPVNTTKPDGNKGDSGNNGNSDSGSSGSDGGSSGGGIVLVKDPNSGWY